LSESKSENLFILKTCPTLGELNGYRFGKERSGEFDWVNIAVHLTECSKCREQIPRFTKNDFRQAVAGTFLDSIFDETSKFVCASGVDDAD
jgi:hypothetical protein